MKIPTLILALFCFGNGCLAQEGPNTVTFYQAPLGVGVRVYFRAATIFCDGQQIARIKAETKYTWTTTPGTHQCSDKKDAKRDRPPLSIEVGNVPRCVDVEFVDFGWPKIPQPVLTLIEKGRGPNEMPYLRRLRSLN
jgi:hypothetical protein